MKRNENELKKEMEERRRALKTVEDFERMEDAQAVQELLDDMEQQAPGAARIMRLRQRLFEQIRAFNVVLSQLEAKGSSD